MTNEEYFSQAENFVNEKYSNANGSFMDFQSADGSGYAGDSFSADGMARGTGDIATSQPILLNIVNSTNAIVNANIFGSFTNRTATNFGNVAAITITSVITTTTYAEILGQLEQKPLKVAEIYLNAVAGSSAQVTQPISVTCNDYTGNQSTKAIVPQIDPNQNQSSVNIVRYIFPLTGYTTLVIPILALATLQLSVYPSQTADPSRRLQGADVTKGYANPGIIRPLQIATPAMAALPSA